MIKKKKKLSCIINTKFNDKKNKKTKNHKSSHNQYKFVIGA